MNEKNSEVPAGELAINALARLIDEHSMRNVLTMLAALAVVRYQQSIDKTDKTWLLDGQRIDRCAATVIN